MVRGARVGCASWRNGAVRASEEGGAAAGSVDLLVLNGSFLDGFFVVSGEERHFVDRDGFLDVLVFPY